MMSRGIIIPLRTKLRDRDLLHDKLWGEESLLGFNLEGTLVYSDEGRPGADAPGLYFDRANPTGAMLNELNRRGVAVTKPQARSYAMIWDQWNELEALTLQQFLERTGQTNA